MVRFFPQHLGFGFGLDVYSALAVTPYNRKTGKTLQGK
jgi:hypothetical protein